MPCEILVKAQTYTHPDPRIDAAGVYKIGDLVLGFDCPDGKPFGWGTDEGFPKFGIWRIESMSLAEFEEWCLATYGAKPFDSEYSPDIALAADGVTQLPPTAILRRRIYVDKDALPPLGKKLFDVEGRAELPPDPAYIKLKATPVFEDE